MARMQEFDLPATATDAGVWAIASTEDSVSVKGLGDGDGEGIVRVNPLCQRDRRADIASLCHPVHKPTANTRSTMVVAANRCLNCRYRFIFVLPQKAQK